MITDLLELCGFEPEGIGRQLPRAMKTFEKFGLTDEDIKRGMERIKLYYNTDIEGVRKTLGIQLRELFDITLARDEGKRVIIHGTIPQISGETMIAAALHSDDVLVAFPDVVALDTIGAYFDRFDHVYQAIENRWMSAQGAHCSICKIAKGLYALDLIPRPDLFVSLGRTCDEQPKADELMYEFMGVPVQYINLPQDQWDYEVDFPRGRDFMAQELEACKERMESVLGFAITSEMLEEAGRLRDQMMATMRKGRDLMLYGDPVPINAASWDMIRRFGFKPMGRDNLERATEAVALTYEELRRRLNEGIGVVPKGAPRIMVQMAPHADLEFYRMLEDLGIALTVTETATYGPDGAFSVTVATKDKTPFQIWSERILWKTNTASLPVRIKGVIGACKKYNLDGILWAAHYPCRPTAGDAMMIKDAVTKELGLPMLVLEYDPFDSRFHTTPQLETQLETFAEMLKSIKKRKQSEKELRGKELKEKWLKEKEASAAGEKGTAELDGGWEAC
jgi:benzoyl-CoA reductase/2-hydroxyglutaryl-CoA dehydratase subunit BcrC/BadD/HgdB